MRHKDGASETADAFAWIAHLDDGSTYSENGPDGAARGWASLPATRTVTAIALQPRQRGRRGLRIPVPAGSTPVFFRRRQVTLRLDGGEQARRTTTVIGWASDVDARYWAIDDVGNVVTTTDQTTIE